MSKVTVIDANNPADILEVFNVCQSHLLCIASVPGAKESDYIQSTEDCSPRLVNGTDEMEINSVQRANDEEVLAEEVIINNDDQSQATSEGPSSLEEKPSEDSEKAITDIDQSSNTEPQSLETVDSESANIGKVHFVKNNMEDMIIKKNGYDTEGINIIEGDTTIEKMSSIQPTMWLGAQNGAVYVHSAVAKWSVLLHTVMLRDAALSIV